MASVLPVQSQDDPVNKLFGAGQADAARDWTPSQRLSPIAAGTAAGGATDATDPEKGARARKAMAAFHKKDPNFQGTVRLDQLPPNLRSVVQEFDDGDGEINLTELAATLSALQHSRKDAKHYARLACIGAIAGLVMMLIILGLTFLSVKLATPTGVKGDALVVAGTNDPVRVASAEFEVKDGSMKQRDGTAVTTAQASVPQKLDSQLPDSYFNELRFIELKSPNGANLHLDVTARARVPKKLSTNGNIIQLITPVGTLTLDGEIMSFDDKTAPILESAGFELHSETTSSGRRLAAGHEVVGWFNLFHKLTKDLEMPQSATFPEGDHSYTMTRYEECDETCYEKAVQVDEEGNESSSATPSYSEEAYNPNPDNACPAQTTDAKRDGKTILYGTVTIDGVDYKKEVTTVQVKHVDGTAVTRSSTAWDRFPGHALVELAAGKQARTFQTYKKAMYHCVDPNAVTEEEGEDAEADLISSLADGGATIKYHGLVIVNGRELRKYELTAKSAAAVAMGMGTVFVYDDGEFPARLELPVAGVITDITNMNDEPVLAAGDFVLPTCPEGTAENPTPIMGDSIGDCVVEDEDDLWDASIPADVTDGGEPDDEDDGSSGSSTLRLLSSLNTESLDGLHQQLVAENAERAARGLNTRTTFARITVPGICSGTASHFTPSSTKYAGQTFLRIYLSCRTSTHDGGVTRVNGRQYLYFNTASKQLIRSRSGKLIVRTDVLPTLNSAIRRLGRHSSLRKALSSSDISGIVDSLIDNMNSQPASRFTTKGYAQASVPSSSWRIHSYCRRRMTVDDEAITNNAGGISWTTRGAMKAQLSTGNAGDSVSVTATSHTYFTNMNKCWKTASGVHKTGQAGGTFFTTKAYLRLSAKIGGIRVTRSASIRIRPRTKGVCTTTSLSTSSDIRTALSVPIMTKRGSRTYTRYMTMFGVLENSGRTCSASYPASFAAASSNEEMAAFLFG